MGRPSPTCLEKALEADPVGGSEGAWRSRGWGHGWWAAVSRGRPPLPRPPLSPRGEPEPPSWAGSRGEVPPHGRHPRRKKPGAALGPEWTPGRLGSQSGISQGVWRAVWLAGTGGRRQSRESSGQWASGFRGQERAQDGLHPHVAASAQPGSVGAGQSLPVPSRASRLALPARWETRGLCHEHEDVQ